MQASLHATPVREFRRRGHMPWRKSPDGMSHPKHLQKACLAVDDFVVLTSLRARV